MNSRGDFGSSVGYQQAPSETREDAEYNRLSNAISNNIQTFKKNVNSIKRLVDQIGTARDDPGVLDNLQSKQREASKIAKDTSGYLKQLTSTEGRSLQEQRQRKIQQDKLRESFSDILNEFQKVQRLAAEKEKASVRRARTVSIERNEASYQGGFGQESAPQVQMQTESELSLEEIKEREAAIRKLESDILDVNDIFKDLALMVHEQGDVIDSIEANVGTAATHVEQGNVQLEKARDYQKASRKKMCCFLVILLIVAIIIGVVIYVTVGKNNKE